MQAEVTFLTRRGAAVIRKSQIVTGQSIRFGRGTDSEVPLPDIRVELAAAAISQRAEGLFIEKLGDAPLVVRGSSAEAPARIGRGDEILIGPYKVVLTEPSSDVDAAFSVELVQPLGDTLQRLTAGSRVRLDQTHLSKRGASWVAFLLLTVLCLAVPVVLYMRGSAVTPRPSTPAAGGSTYLGSAWNPGELSNQHRYFAQHCATCHESSFTRVKDSACLTCHAAIGSHIEAAAIGDFAAAHRDLQGTRCAECHEEHRGLRSLVIREGALCVQCHRSLAESAPKAEIRDVRGFPDGHPQFRVSLVADAAKRSTRRVILGSDPKPADRPNLTFSHAAHLVPAGFPALGYKPMACADCHVSETGGEGFLPITYKGQCQHCHALKFDAELPWQEVPHGDDARVEAEIEGYYASIAVERGVPAPSAPEIERRVPGSVAPTGSEPPGRRAWVRQQTARALGIVFDEKRGCYYCHAPDPARGQFRVAPVMMLIRFLAPARFDHAKHAPIDCIDCHDARQSQASSDVLIPGIERCTTCHGAETASFNVQSTCTLCHVFHRKELGPMRRIAGREK
jgi:predicted CXXCH cytochrome family protein